MEIAIVKDHTTSLNGSCFTANYQIVVEDEAQFRIALQVTLHLDDSIDGRINDHTVSIE